ncbi:hypothetical protein [Micromonospora echinospora]|uniref:hypothetical protein n=1 Tax=Micromonospora echinospora TaxID=1877 RepID=UPI003A897E22
MATGWYAQRPAPLLTAALAGAVAGWLARSRLTRRGAGAPTVVQPTAPEPPVAQATGPEPGMAEPTGPEPTAPAGGRSAPSGSTRGPSPLPEPVPFPEGMAVDAPYTAEEPYTGRPRYAPAARPWRTDVPGGTPP